VEQGTDTVPSQPEEHPSVLSERRGGVTVVTIDRPRVRNAVDAATSYAVDAAVSAAEADPDTGAIVVTGTGDRAFCSGMDMKEASIRGTGLGLIPGRGFCGITERAVSKPLIAAVNGAAVAGGFEIVLACDLVVAAEGAAFGLPEIKRGLVALTGGVQRLAGQLPRAAAMEIILTGKPVSAERLLELGVINRVVPANRVLQAAIELADAVLANSWHAIGHAKALFDFSRDAPLPEAIAHGRTLYDAVLHSSDSVEGVAAYAEKRSARFAKGGEG
jgi:enoyl-CoA hydratase/carnithine racemase